MPVFIHGICRFGHGTPGFLVEARTISDVASRQNLEVPHRDTKKRGQSRALTPYAAMPVRSFVRHFREEFAHYIEHGHSVLDKKNTSAAA